MAGEGQTEKPSVEGNGYFLGKQLVRDTVN